MKRHSDELMASADTVGAYSTNTNRSPPRSRPNLVTISNVQTNFVTQGINNSNIQFNTVQPFSTPTMPVLALNDKIPGSLPGGSVMPALHTIQTQHSIQQIRQKVIPSSTIIQHQQQQTQFQRLKVEDALSYLDQVKFKFSNHPQVYNDFLDIMKEFKSQSIDTPGVITRVSNLFKGHPELIVGFNTFLPPGYKIEIKNNELGFHVSVSIPQSPAITSSQTIIHSTTQHIMSSTPIVTTPPVTLTTTPPVVIKPAGHLPINQVNTTSVVINHHTVHNSVTPTAPSTSFHPTQIPLSVASLSQVAASNIPQVSIPTTQESTNSHNQPVEFNHAINYVNKIKNRFQGQPEKYKRFLEILHTYQKEQKSQKDNMVPLTEKTLTEAEVYQQVAKLFENQDDLLVEFGQFLPDAKTPDAKLATETITVPKKTSVVTSIPPPIIVPPVKKDVVNTPIIKESIKETSVQNISLKRTSSFSSSQNLPPPKRPKSPFPCLGDISYVEAYKYGTLTDFAFFDLVRKSIHNSSAYDDFLRCLVLYYNEIISKSELLNLVQPFLGKYSELFRRFKDFIGTSEKSNNATTAPTENKLSGLPHLSLLDPGSNRQDRSAGDLPTDIDYSICKRLGASYCAVPSDYKTPKCSGRTKMCFEVLNDTWVSFPTWSEESSFATSRKTQYEEYMHRCEDERFELDLVMEINLSAIYSLEEILRKTNRMTFAELDRFRLDDNLGTQPSLMSTNVRAIRRLYGERTKDILEGLKINPVNAIPVVLKRLRSKDDEWKEARNTFNELWKNQNEKYYLKSLDHQGVNFKQSDMKFLRSKSLLNEIETIFDERNEQSDNNNGPHMVFSYTDKSIIDDAANLLIHHVKRQSGINKEDKQKVKSLIRSFIPDMFHHPRQELSDDEHDGLHDFSNNNSPESSKLSLRISEESNLSEVKTIDSDKLKEYSNIEECYTLFFGNNYWYLFLRLHHILCDRLTQIYKRATQLLHDECIYQVTRSESVAAKLNLLPKSDIMVEDYYPALLDMVKNVLDGNLDAITYEDTLREMFSIHAYIGFTLDKVVAYAVRQLQNLVTDESCQECYNIFLKESKKNGTGGLCSTACQRVAQEAAYQRKVEAALNKTNNCYKIYIYKSNCKLTFELLNNDPDDKDNGKWTTYDNEPLSEPNDDKQEENQSPNKD
ncbi:Paired amphipathic helix,Histone deacetylase interacting domain,Sin3, C-terminal [Cinara cedri]|uniref:Paired amphipathic helix protein Sin3a n=1 Tax=Cinara cedri TaxID=506608 RepID=A0A5E4MFA8_9HEMI|nr:Paired amphipathic helix,Histone deacetylase interacting domain,Sin3, C-terminal [Cinara cedri]